MPFGAFEAQAAFCGQGKAYRHKNCDIILNYSTVSRLHAVVVCTKSGWYITGIKSDAGVLINGKPLEKKQLLKTGDKITLGSITLIFDNKQG